MKIAVIGGGPGGMIAAGTAAHFGGDVTLFDKNEKLGKKLYITGKGRCNVTNNVEIDEFMKSIVTNSKFMFSALRNFSPSDSMSLIEKYGTQLKTERGNRVFPATDKASDITKAMSKYMSSNGVVVKLNSEIKKIDFNDSSVLLTINDEQEIFDKVIIATGGISYSLTGSTGDGYRWARSIGHNIIKPKPALIGINTIEHYDLQGLSLENVTCSLLVNNKLVAKEFGEMLFTHTGVSGPIVLSLSSVANRFPPNDSVLEIDLKPALSIEQLENRLLRDFSLHSNKQFGNYLTNLLPQRLISCIIERSKIYSDLPLHQITIAQRTQLIKELKNFQLRVQSIGEIEGAIVTSGGIDCKQINPSTMESKLNNRVYFVGEIIDIDALTGGFNIQLAMSTGYLAGISCVKE